MKILVLATGDAWEELVKNNSAVEWMRAENKGAFSGSVADAYINLSEDAAEMNYTGFKKTVIINSVSKTLTEMQAGKNVYRINGWKGFTGRSTWEVAGEMNDEAAAVFSAMNKTVINAPDEPGFIAARVISMIINEAYFALDEEVSTKAEIDTAMKLGTNYPYGPFEWTELIGPGNIYELLSKLTVKDKRYSASARLQQEATDKR